MPTVTALAALLFAAVHVLIDRMRFLSVIPRSRWLSFAGGVAVAYVFLHILPELAAHPRRLAEQLHGTDVLEAEKLVYSMALVGLAVFYGLERAVRGSRGERIARTGEDRAGPRTFWIHMGSFGIYNVLIGYLLLHREEEGLRPLLLYVVAMALHFLTNDFGLRQDHQERYDRIGRWLLAAAVLLGWAVGLLATLAPTALAFLFAFLAGGIVLNVLKEELPEDRKARFAPFALGAGAYAALLLLLPALG